MCEVSLDDWFLLALVACCVCKISVGRAPRTARGDCYSRRETGDSYVIVKLGNEVRLVMTT